jgi:hypothetical protein
MNRFRTHYLAYALRIVLGCAVSGRAQAETENKGARSNALGVVAGSVVNESGQPMRNAVVTIRSYGAGEGRSVTTDEEGNLLVNYSSSAQIVAATAASVSEAGGGDAQQLTQPNQIDLAVELERRGMKSPPEKVLPDKIRNVHFLF